MIWRADTDKAHRCPGRSLPIRHPRECNGGYVSCEATGWRFRYFHVYACDRCPFRVTIFPGWPHYPGTERYRSRIRWWLTRGLKYRAQDLVWWLRTKRSK